MIISCEECHKKFEIESNLIPEKGRLLQCSACSHKWFYKKDSPEETKVVLKQQDIKPKKIDPKIKAKRKHSYTHIESKNLSFLNLILVFIISIIALIVLLDTFKDPISLVFPRTEFILESLYEIIKDILLFTQDLL